MKKLFILCQMFFALCLHSQNISLMTYNIKLDYPKEGENSWENRKPFMLGQLQFYEPDVFGVQEAMPNQMKDLDSLLFDYDFVGVGRDDGLNQGEYSAIFYNTKRFKVLKSFTFWLSDTPESVSMGWDAVCNRICTYALFEENTSRKKFYVFNTHFDHVGIEARKNSAILILKKIADINTEGHPVVLMGDFNMEESHESIQLIKKYLNDSKYVSTLKPFGPTGTFNGFNFYGPVINRIDYIFVDSKFSVNKYAVLSDSKNCKYPSDHLPVLIFAKIIN